MQAHCKIKPYLSNPSQGDKTKLPKECHVSGKSLKKNNIKYTFCNMLKIPRTTKIEHVTYCANFVVLQKRIVTVGVNKYLEYMYAS